MLIAPIDCFKYIRNIGTKSIEEIEKFVSTLSDKNFNVEEYHYALKLNIPYEIYINRFDIINGDLSFMEGRNYSDREYKILQKYIESIYIVEPELLRLCYSNPEKIKSIAHSLSVFSFVLDKERRIRKLKQED